MTKASLSDLARLAQRKGLLLAFITASAGAGILAAACSSGSSGGPGFQSGPDSSMGNEGDGGTVTGEAGACANPTVGITFAPMYSAYIPGSTQQVFALPAITDDGNTATWSLSDPSQASLQPQMFDDGTGQMVPGVMLTMKGTGDSQGNVTVFATESGGACGSAVLHITSNMESDWTIGEARYNDGVSIHLGPPGDGGFMRPEGGFPEGGFHGGGGFGSDAGSYFEADGGTACTNCHGPMAMGGVGYNDVSHTPEQTGGFSDQDLANIILNGQIPDGGYFDPSVIITGCDGGMCAQRAYQRWSSFHRWTDITQDQLPGIICYLRSLTPAPQNGTSNFGGGGHHHDGGFGPPPSNDAAAAGD